MNLVIDTYNINKETDEIKLKSNIKKDKKLDDKYANDNTKLDDEFIYKK